MASPFDLRKTISKETSSKSPLLLGHHPASSNANYGGIDPENEDNLKILHYVSDEGLRNDATDRRKMLDSSSDRYYPYAAAPGEREPSHLYPPDSEPLPST
jgi:hypothetical protein